MDGEPYRNMVPVPDMHVFLQAQDKGSAPAFQPTHPPLADEFPISAQAGYGPTGKGFVEPGHQVCALPGVGITRLVKQHPKQRDTDFPVDDAQHQDVDMAVAKFPVRAIQRQVRWSRKIGQGVKVYSTV